MFSVLNSEANTSCISYSSLLTLAIHFFFSDVFINSDLEFSLLLGSQQILSINILNNSVLTSALNPNLLSNPQLNILSNRHEANKCARYPDCKNFEIEIEFVQKKDRFMH